MLRVEKDLDEIRRRLTALFGGPYPDKVDVKPAALKELRRKCGKSQSQLAEETQVAQYTIANIERGRVKESDTIGLLALSLALDCSLRQIASIDRYLGGRLTEQEFQDVASLVRDVVMVRTLASPVDRRDLREFYYPARLSTGNRILEPGQDRGILHGFPKRPCIVQGKAGQGKSIFLRYTTAKLFDERHSLPLFIELRSLGGESIENVLKQQLSILGMDSSAEYIDMLLRQASVSLLFDALDELSIAERASFLKQVTSLHQRYPTLRIIITSRPLTGSLGDCFEILQIEPLRAADLQPVVRCYASADESARIMTQVAGASVELGGLLTTPLLILLMVIHFRYSDSIPDSTISFYKDLLDLLLRRHNISDSGLKRPITSGLETTELRHFFEALCFLVRVNHGQDYLHKSDLDDLAARALEVCGLNATPWKALEDIVQITNLLLEEARGQYQFIHATVSEYHAAAFIKSASLENARVFYKSLSDNWKDWLGELEFLQQIDRLRCVQEFLIPDLSCISTLTAASCFTHFDELLIKRCRRDSRNVYCEILFIGTSRYCLRNWRPFLHVEGSGSHVLQTLEYRSYVQGHAFIDKASLRYPNTFELSEVEHLLSASRERDYIEYINKFIERKRMDLQLLEDEVLRDKQKSSMFEL